jgi:disulfide bond formation protein DsbB
MSRTDLARWLAFLTPAALLAGAYGSQYLGGLAPCDMCWWQRYPHFAALGASVLALLISKSPMHKWLVALTALAIITSGVIGGYHAGVEYQWWLGPQNCSQLPQGSGADLLKNIMEQEVVRCDVVPWDLFGISLAGFNFLISVGSGLVILGLLISRKKP